MRMFPVAEQMNSSGVIELGCLVHLGRQVLKAKWVRDRFVSKNCLSQYFSHRRTHFETVAASASQDPVSGFGMSIHQEMTTWRVGVLAYSRFQ